MSVATRRRPRGAPVEPLSKKRLRLWLRLLRTTRSIEAELRERLRLEFDTTLPRFDALAALYRQGHGAGGSDGHAGGLSMTALSRGLLVSNGNATVIVERLVKDGLVARATAAKDRRSTVVQLTPAGARQFMAMADAHEGWISSLLAEIGADEVDLITRILNRQPHALQAPGLIEKPGDAE